MQCHEIMTSPVESVTPDATVELAARKMADHLLGFLPVCDACGTAVGVLTDRDLALRVCATSRSPQDTLVAEVMSQPVVACRAYDPVARIERLMTNHRVSRIVVTDDQELLVGIVSLTDLAQHWEPLRTAGLVRELTSRAFRFKSPRGVRSVPPPDSQPASARPRRARVR